jgi:hypothetical protein
VKCMKVFFHGHVLLMQSFKLDVGVQILLEKTYGKDKLTLAPII